MKMKYVEMVTDERIIHNGYVMGYAKFGKLLKSPYMKQSLCSRVTLRPFYLQVMMQ